MLEMAFFIFFLLMKMRIGYLLLILAGSFFAPLVSTAQFLQQGSKLIPLDGINQPYFGFSVALSGDGNTAVIGGLTDNFGNGAVWIFERSGTAWLRKAKLLGTGTKGSSQQGHSVAISADGSTVLVGAIADDSFRGAAWVFLRVQDQWVQQGKLVPADAAGASLFGTAVALSATGNTAMIGGMHDDANKGAAWIFERRDGVWAQQGPKLTGSGSVGLPVYQGASVALSADGNTALTGGWEDNAGVGAAWVFVRTDSTWSQQGNKLTGSDAAGKPSQGYSVDLSADGNIAVVGAHNDNGGQGGAFIYKRTNSSWQQLGSKISGTGSNGPSIQGRSVSISEDGSIIVVSGETDSFSVGAAWVFQNSGAGWQQLGSKLVGTGHVGFSNQGRSSAVSGDGSTIIVGGYQDSSLTGAAWIYSSITAPALENFSPVVAAPGTTVVLSGLNFTPPVTSVTFGEVPATSFSIINNNTIEAKVGNGASGKIKIRNAKGTAVIEGFIFSTATSVSSLAPGEFVKIFAGPSSGNLNLDYQLNSSRKVHISLYNLQGVRLYEQLVHAAPVSVSLPQLAAGIYLVQIRTPDNKRRFTGKLVIY
jgi:hypothetical protein